MATINLAGSTSGTTSLIPTAIAGTGTLTLPTGTDTLVGLAATQTLTNKTLGSGTVLPAGSVRQVVNYQTGAVATGTTVIPADDTIPQNTEGDQYLSLAITPVSATSTLVITCTLVVSESAGASIIGALFQDTTANALAATWSTKPAYNASLLNFTYTMTSGTTSATTFKMRVGPQSASTVTVNGVGGSRYFGGVLSSSITITEVVT